MAVLWVRQDYKRREANRDIERSSLSREFLALTDDPADGEWTVRLATGVPRVFDQHPENSAARVRQVTANPDQGSNVLWRIRVDYATGLPNAPSENPLDQPMRRSWSFVPYIQLFEKAYDPTSTSFYPTIPVHNSAKMPFVPGLEDESHLAMLTIQRNEAVYNAALALAYQDTVNREPFYGAPPGTAKFFGGGANEVPDGPFTYWQVTYQILFHRYGFSRVVADKGTYEYYSPQNRWFPIMEKDSNGKSNGKKVSEPVYLDGAGHVWNGTTPIYLEFHLNQRVSWAPLNLE